MTLNRDGYAATMRPIHFFILIILAILIGVGAWLWWNQKGPPAEVNIPIEPPIKVEEPDSLPIDPGTPPVSADTSDPLADFQKSDCNWLVRHVPADDVAYKPGVDVNGNKVVPADLNGSYSFEMPKTVTATVSRRLLGHENLRQETPFAEVEIDLTTGEVKINGQGLTNDETKDLIAFCQKSVD